MRAADVLLRNDIGAYVHCIQNNKKKKIIDRSIWIHFSRIQSSLETLDHESTQATKQMKRVKMKSQI